MPLATCGLVGRNDTLLMGALALGSCGLQAVEDRFGLGLVQHACEARHAAHVAATDHAGGVAKMISRTTRSG